MYHGVSVSPCIYTLNWHETDTKQIHNKYWCRVRAWHRVEQQQWIPRSHKRFITVSRWIGLPQFPITTCDVDCAVMNLSRKWCWRVILSGHMLATHGAAERGRSLAVPVTFTRETNPEIVLAFLSNLAVVYWLKNEIRVEYTFCTVNKWGNLYSKFCIDLPHGETARATQAFFGALFRWPEMMYWMQNI